MLDQAAGLSRSSEAWPVITPEDCLAYAMRAAQFALSAEDPWLQTAFVNLEAMWLRMADRSAEKAGSYPASCPPPKAGDTAGEPSIG